jgi:hypothetical protein
MKRGILMTYGWKRMTREEMIEKVCELYKQNGVEYSLEKVNTMNEDELMDEMIEYAEI